MPSFLRVRANAIFRKTKEHLQMKRAVQPAGYNFISSSIEGEVNWTERMKRYLKIIA